jgi:integrase
MVAALPRRRDRYSHPDPELPKHFIRVYPQGPARYYVITRDPFGKQVWTKVGSSAEMPVAEAREIARGVIRRVKQGLPAFEPAKPKRDSVAVVTAEWLKRYVHKNGLRSAAEYHRIIGKYIVPHWGKRAFEEIRRSDIARLLDHVEDEHGPHQSDAVLSVLRMVGSWQRDRTDDYSSPFVGIKSRIPKQHRKRDRVLTDDEIRAIWTAADKAGAFGAVMQLLLLTAQRLDKVCTMRWSDISQSGMWTIRTEAREKGNAGTLQLPPLALEIIKRQPHFAGNDFVFAGANGGAFANVHRQKAALAKLSGTSDWRNHDMRRTARTLLSRAGVQPHIAERTLGHALGPIEEIYNRHQFTEEKGDALRRLAALLERIVHPPGDNIVPLHEAVS